MQNPDEFQESRSPQELRRYVIELKEMIESDTEERHLGLQKRGLHKEFLDELVPLSCFAVLAYPDSCKVRPVLGNQGYDAIIFDENGNEIDRAEITAPHDGKAAADDANLVVNRGYGAVSAGEPGHDFEELFGPVLETCRKKALKDYSECSLVVSIAPWPPFPGFEARYEAQIAAMVKEMAKIEFNAKRVFLLILPDRLEAVHT